MIADAFRWYGSLWGDQREFLTCDEHGGEIAWTSDESHLCPVGGCELYVHVGRAERYEILYLCWKADQKWLPQRYFAVSEPSYRYWEWLGREWLKRPWDFRTT